MLKKTFGNYISVQQKLFNSGGLVYNDKNIESFKDLIKMNLFILNFLILKIMKLKYILMVMISFMTCLTI